jgi:hypothetical protein
MTDTFGFPINATPRKIILDVHLYQPLVGQPEFLLKEASLFTNKSAFENFLMGCTWFGNCFT